MLIGERIADLLKPYWNLSIEVFIMPVQQQTPYIEYECNGTTTVFPLSFDCDDSAYLIVKLDGKNASTSDWLLSSGSVVFQVAPKTGSKLSIKRNLPLERLTNYGSYDNSMRPQVLNSDFDNIWFKLQEHNYQIQYSGTGLENISLIANQALDKADQAGNDIQLINNHLVKFSNSAGYVYARQVVGRDGQNQEKLNTEVRPITTGGTGATNIEGARQNFEVYSKSQVDVLIKTGGETSIIGISGGGTGAETVEQARTNLDIYSKEEVDTEKLGKNETAIKAKALENPLTINEVKVDVGGELNISGDRIGRIQWYPIRREKIPVGELALDGFIYNRADYPDLWALVESGFYEAITEAAWRADPRKRGKFSDGNGSTTFRVPDINGVQESSIQNLFVRGSCTDDLAGRVQDNAMMAITGSILLSDPTTGALQGFGQPGVYKGAFKKRGSAVQRMSGLASAQSEFEDVTTIEFDSSGADIPHDTEIRPRSI